MPLKLRAAATSIGVNVVLLVSKILVAIITGSVGLLAECIHSSFDLFSSLLAYLGIKKASKAEDETHHYGHEKFESLSSFLQSIFILLTAAFIVYEAVQKLRHPVTVENSGIGIIFMIITIPVAYLTSRYLAKIARKEGGSHALEADSAHFTTDVLGSIAVLIGLFMVWLGYPIGDTLAAFVVAAVMLYISCDLIHDSFHVFMDCSPPKKTMKKIENILKKTRGITYHKLRARMAGSRIFVDVHIQVNKNYTIDKAHGVSGKIKHEIKEKIKSVKEVNTHIEPKV